MGAATGDDDRKRLDELVTRYQLDPDIRDVYVEGEWDRRFVTWFLQKAGVKGVVVYDIDGVHIPADVLVRHGLGEGKKERVVALAYELANQLDDPTQVTCIADRDYDTLLDRVYSSPLLFQTDYSCQEMYFVNEETLRKFFALVAGKPVSDVLALMNKLLGVLVVLHLHRAVNLSLRWGLQWLDPTKCCSLASGHPALEEEEFTVKYLMKNGRVKDKNAFVAELSRLRAKVSTNLLMHVTKDDFYDILVIVLRKQTNDVGLHRPDTAAAALAGCIEFATLIQFPLYQQLHGRFAM